ncbi:MAG: tetratricopeptide repeat protein, partial [Acidobacteria bacterium]|nr:tetratricopeptide repeat protein [Acidobacteriota bacterium]
LVEYEGIVRDFPHDVFARNGRGEVLKALGRLDEALVEYEGIVRDFPHDVFARNGRGEVLKAQGRLEEAFQEYDGIVRDFPNEVVPRSGRAEVLKALGRLDEALVEYEGTVRDFPYNVVARTGRAEVLKALGRLDEALRQYDDNLERFPADRWARNGKAATLSILGRFEEALELLLVRTPRTLNDWVGFHIRGMALMKQGNLDAAMGIFERGIRESPWFETVNYFRSALAVALLRRQEFRMAAEAIKDDEAIVSTVLRIHIFGELGQTQLAKDALERVKASPLSCVIVLRDEFAARYGLEKRRQAPRSDQWVFEKECDLLLEAA